MKAPTYLLARVRAAGGLDAARPYRRSARGFSLIELLVALAIVAILAAIAYPSYVDKVRRSRRVEAKSLLLKAANREEQLYTTTNGYPSSMSALGLSNQSENGYYQVNVQSGTYQGNGWYTLTATAEKDQVNDTCRTMIVDSQGLKTAWTGDAAGVGTNVSSTCW